MYSYQGPLPPDTASPSSASLSLFRLCKQTIAALFTASIFKRAKSERRRGCDLFTREEKYKKIDRLLLVGWPFLQESDEQIYIARAEQAPEARRTRRHAQSAVWMRGTWGETRKRQTVFPRTQLSRPNLPHVSPRIAQRTLIDSKE